MNTADKISGLKPTNKEIMKRTSLECPVVGHELFNFLCGDMIGYGVSRAVFEYRRDPTCVIKIEREDYCANAKEMEYWRHVEHTEAGKWFAPCVELSYHGKILIQKKATELPWEKYPKKLPEFLTDTKYQNYGMYKGKFVCFDYATCLLPSYGISKKLRAVEWWNANI